MTNPASLDPGASPPSLLAAAASFCASSHGTHGRLEVYESPRNREFDEDLGMHVVTVGQEEDYTLVWIVMDELGQLYTECDERDHTHALSARSAADFLGKLRKTGCAPKLFDIAEGVRSFDLPLGAGKLIARVHGESARVFGEEYGSETVRYRALVSVELANTLAAR